MTEQENAMWAKWEKHLSYDGEYVQAEGNGTVECFETVTEAVKWLEEQLGEPQ